MPAHDEVNALLAELWTTSAAVALPGGEGGIMHRSPESVVALWADASAAPLHAVSLTRRDFDRLVEVAGLLVGRDQSAVNAQPEVQFFQERLASSRALLAALHQHQWGTRVTRSPR